MRKATLITGIILLLLGASSTGFFVSADLPARTFTAPTNAYLSTAFISSFGTWTLELSWSNLTGNSTGPSDGKYLFFLTSTKPGACNNVTDWIAVGGGAQGSLVAQVTGGTRWYMFFCTTAGGYAAFQVVVHAFGFSYYLVTGIGLVILGGVVTVVAFAQRPAPPILSSAPSARTPSRRPPTR